MDGMGWDMHTANRRSEGKKERHGAARGLQTGSRQEPYNPRYSTRLLQRQVNVIHVIFTLKDSRVGSRWCCRGGGGKETKNGKKLQMQDATPPTGLRPASVGGRLLRLHPWMRATENFGPPDRTTQLSQQSTAVCDMSLTAHFLRHRPKAELLRSKCIPVFTSARGERAYLKHRAC